jgi:hypothetical protein
MLKGVLKLFCGLDSIGPVEDELGGCCEHGNGSSTIGG